MALEDIWLLLLILLTRSSSWFVLSTAGRANFSCISSQVNFVGTIRSQGTNCGWLLKNRAELEAFERREPLVFKFVAETIPLVDHLNHDDGVSYEELLNEAGSLDLRMSHQEHDHDLYLIDEWEKVEELGDVV